MNPIETLALEIIHNKLGTGWDAVFQRQGLVLHATDPVEQQRDALTRPLPQLDRTSDLAQDFSTAAARAIEPGDPAKSLLYHAWARGETDPQLDGLEPDALDALENYIYWLGRSLPLPQEPLYAVTLAYDYRPANATPHRKHADLVFSRTALTRVGSQPAHYDTAAQIWLNWAPSAGDNGAFCATRARLGVFLCRKLPGNTTEAALMARDEDDAHRSVYVPVRKLIVGVDYPGQTSVTQLSFRSAFVGDKLKRIVDALGEPEVGHRVPPPFDTSRAPFVVRSQLEADSGAGLKDDAYIALTAFAAGCSIGPQARAQLIDYARQDGQIARFTVPPRKDPLGGRLYGSGIDAGNSSWNRHYTSLMVVGSVTRLAFEGISELLEHSFPDWLYPLPKLRPRPAPEFVNIRHKVEANGSVTILSHQPDSAYESQLDRGGYMAAFFDDGMFDGAVWACVNGEPTKPAFVVVTAPDFFPEADQEDLQVWADQHPEHNIVDQFKEGGPSPLCAGRFCANLLLRDPWTDTPLFQADETMVTAIVSRPTQDAKGQGTPAARGTYRRHRGGYLPDSASDEFAPGWDLSYDKEADNYYYTTHGLGSPFPEDVKFCASANAYWPAASPDAARTFKRPHVPTAIPMLDAELGLHPARPDAPTGSRPGWDGEYGPFFQSRDGVLGVNFADIRRSDYVANALAGHFAHNAFDTLSSDALIQRMEALRRCIDVIPVVEKRTVAQTGYWLVSARCLQMPNGDTQYHFEFCVPDSHPPAPAPTPTLQATDPGYWRLWCPVAQRVRATLSFAANDPLNGGPVKQAAFDPVAGEYGPWN